MRKIFIYKKLLVFYVCTALTTSMFASDNVEADEVNDKIEDVKQYTNLAYEHPDSALQLVNSLFTSNELKGNSRLNIIYLQALCVIKRASFEFDTAYVIAEQALGLSIELNDTILLIDSYTKYGELNNAFQQKDKAGECFNMALFLTKEMINRNKVDIQKLVSSYYNMVLFHERFGKLDEAEKYLDSCYMIADTATISSLSLAYLHAEKGFFLLNKYKAEEAIFYLLKAKEVFEDLDSVWTVSHSGYLANIYSYLGEASRLNDSKKASAYYFEKALLVLEENTRHEDHKPYILQQYAWLLFEMGEYSKANDYLNESIRINEKYLSAKSFTESDFLIVSNRFRKMLSQRWQEITLKNLELAKKDRALQRFRIFTIAIVLLLFIVILLYRMKRMQFRYNLEKAEMLAKENQAKNEVRLKNRELTASTLRLIEKNQIIRKVSDELKKHDSDSSKKVLLSVSKNSDGMWDDFNNRFMAVNQDFYKKLNAKLPGLSSNDLKICALIKLNFSTKEMSQLLGISHDSVQKARHRLRKKLNLGRDVNLTSFISSI